MRIRPSNCDTENKQCHSCSVGTAAFQRIPSTARSLFIPSATPNIGSVTVREKIINNVLTTHRKNNRTDTLFVPINPFEDC